MKTGLLEIRPIFVRKESRTRGHVFCCLLALKLQRELERRLVAVFGTTVQDPTAITVSDALAARGRLSFLTFNVDKKTAVMRLPKPDQQQRKMPGRPAPSQSAVPPPRPPRYVAASTSPSNPCSHPQSCASTAPAAAPAQYRNVLAQVSTSYLINSAHWFRHTQNRLLSVALPHCRQQLDPYP